MNETPKLTVSAVNKASLDSLMGGNLYPIQSTRKIINWYVTETQKLIIQEKVRKHQERKN